MNFGPGADRPLSTRAIGERVSAPPLLMTKVEAAKALGVSVRRIDQLRAEGKLLARKLGAKVVFPIRELEAFVDSLPGDADQ